ncbi:hypothetical protein MMC22_002386 [Lobaria immixta]|nr:hypothetical protein [Lobaria immixta]
MFTPTTSHLGDQPFRLFDLPLEIRRIIYGMALCSSPIMPFSNPPESHEISTYPSTKLLCASHRVHDEALDILRSEGQFVVGVCSRSIRFLSRSIYLGKAQPFQPPAWFNTIRRLQIDLFWQRALYPEEQGSELAENLRTVVQALKDNRSVRTLEISFSTPHGPTFMMSEDWIQNEAFNSLKRLRFKQVFLSGNFLGDPLVAKRLQELKLIMEGNTLPNGISAVELKWLGMKELIYSHGGIEPDEWFLIRLPISAMLREDDEGFEASRAPLERHFRARDGF